METNGFRRILMICAVCAGLLILLHVFVFHTMNDRWAQVILTIACSMVPTVIIYRYEKHPESHILPIRTGGFSGISFSIGSACLFFGVSTLIIIAATVVLLWSGKLGNPTLSDLPKYLNRWELMLPAGIMVCLSSLLGGVLCARMTSVRLYLWASIGSAMSFCGLAVLPAFIWATTWGEEKPLTDIIWYQFGAVMVFYVAFALIGVRLVTLGNPQPALQNVG
jgi:uncharacterized integral membrane protein